MNQTNQQQMLGMGEKAKGKRGVRNFLFTFVFLSLYKKQHRLMRYQPFTH